MSVLNNILNAVKQRLDILQTLPTVVVRKRMIMLDGDSLPIVIVGLLNGETIPVQAFGYIGYEYTIGIALVQAGNRDFTTGIQSDLELRELLRDTLTGVKLTGVPEVWDTNVVEGAPLNMPLAGGNTANYQLSAVQVRYKTMEIRPNY
jgi:hypothetical protein